ncbi:DUF362 domain-containing protein [Planctomycetota bacterium]
MMAAIGTLWWPISLVGNSATGGIFTPPDPANQPIGTARGTYPGRVVWVFDPNATSWDRITGYWSEDIYTNPVAVNEMLSKGLCLLTGQNHDADAWDTLFQHFNQMHDKGPIGYQTGEKIAVKLNLARSNNHGDPGNNTYTAPQLVEALLKQLVNIVKVAPGNITIYDASQYIPATIYDRCNVGELAGVRFVDNTGGDGRIKAVRDPCAVVHHAHPEVPLRWLPRSVAEADYIINLAGLKGHVLTGVTLCAKNHFGSTWVKADSRYPGWKGREGFWPGHDIHKQINAFDTTQEWAQSSFEVPARPAESYNPLVELMGHRHLGNKTVLFLVDGLYAALHMGTPITDSPKWQMPPFNNDWTSSLFLSQDGLAIDSVCLDFLRCEPTMEFVADPCNYSIADDYLHEAALADDPASGTFYDPDGTGERLAGLGVHEHWNNAIDKQYSRNLGMEKGIELISYWTTNQPPQVQADCDPNVIFTGYPVTLAGTVTDDNYPHPPGAVTITWSKYSGPGLVRFIDPNHIETNASFTVPGTYILSLTANDGQDISSNDIKIIVALPGDFNLDGRIDVRDLYLLSTYWLQNHKFYDMAPMPNGDGIINLSDFAVLSKHWLDGIH